MQIEGIGDGATYKAKVTKKNQLETKAEIHVLSFEQSFHHGLLYTLALLASSAVGASGTEVLATILNTDPSLLLCIDRINAQGDDPQGFFQVWVDSVSGADGTAYTPVNHNRRSGNMALATVYVTDTTLTATGGSQVAQKGVSPESPSVEFDFGGGLILGLNDTMDLRFLEQDAATPNVGFSITGFYVEPE